MSWCYVMIFSFAMVPFIKTKDKIIRYHVIISQKKTCE